MADYLVTATAELEEEFGFVTINLFTLSGNGVAGSSSPLQLEPGDRVGFRKIVSNSGGGGTPSNTVVASNFSSDHWTSTNNITLGTSYTYKTIKTGVSVSVSDLVRVEITAGFSSDFQNTYYIGAATNPDLTVEVTNDNIQIASTATSFTQTIQNTTGSSTENNTITEYRIATPSGGVHESRTGYGSITVTDVPPNPGFPKTYSVQGRISTSNGGSGIWQNVQGSSFTVIATTTASGNGPTLDPYGMAIFDHNENLVTSFTAGHTVLRKIFASSSTTLSTSASTDIDTGLTGITTSNCVILVEGDTSSPSTSGAKSIPATFVTGGNGNIHVRLARVTVAQSVRVAVLQYSGETIGATSSTYGIQIKNGDNNTVIDEASTVYCVKEIIDIDSSQSTQTLYESTTTNFIYLTLTQGRYPSAQGAPIAALNCSTSNLIVPPKILGTKHTDGSFKTVFMMFPKNVSLSNYKLAMIVPQDTSTPEYYGGSSDQYAMVIRNSSGDDIWRSDWRQAIVNNVIPINQFTSGTNQNGNYDVTTGRDGVIAPTDTTSDFEATLQSSDTTVSLTGLNEMDPANSYVAGNMCTTRIEYHKGRFLDVEQGIDELSGGGIHDIALRISGFTTSTLATYRYRDGSSNGTNYGVRSTDSHHPEGDMIVFRII